MKMNWGTGITIALVVYMTGIVSVVIFTFQKDVNLVTEDYYAQELAYDDQIARIRNTDALELKPSLEYVRNAEAVRLSFPKDLDPEEGTVLFFRPSDFTMDKSFDLKLNEDQIQGFDFSKMQAGMWKVKLQWEMAGKSFYQEFVVVK